METNPSLDMLSLLTSTCFFDFHFLIPYSGLWLRLSRSKSEIGAGSIYSQFRVSQIFGKVFEHFRQVIHAYFLHLAIGLRSLPVNNRIVNCVKL